MKLILIASTPESIIPFRGKLIRALANNGIDIHVCAPFTEEDSNIIRELKVHYNVKTHTVELRRAGINLLSDFRYMLALISVIKAVRPDFIFSYTMKPVIYGSIAGWIMNVSGRYSMITGLGFIFIDAKGLVSRVIQGLAKLLLAISVRRNNKVFFQNTDDKDVFIEQGIVAKYQPTAVVNGSGVDLVHYNVKPVPSEASFLLIARMIQNKGIKEYIDAIREVKTVYPLAKFTMVGGVEENIDAISLKDILSWVSEGLVDYKGALLDVRGEIEKCSIYVLPSYREGTPRSVLEAMSMGRAIITTDVPGCRDTVIDGVTGFLVPSKNSKGLADAMKRLIQDKELRESMGQKSREYAVKKYSDDSVAAEIISHLDL